MHLAWYHFPFENIAQNLLLFFWSGLHGPISCSLLGGGFSSQKSSYKVTRICPSITLFCYFVLLPSILASCPYRDIPSFSPIESSPSDSAAASAALFFEPSKYIPACSHHRCYTLAPGLRADCSQRSRIGCVAIYYATVFCLLVMYFPTPPETCFHH